jgi:hypothetical protein
VYEPLGLTIQQDEPDGDCHCKELKDVVGLGHPVDGQARRYAYLPGSSVPREPAYPVRAGVQDPGLGWLSKGEEVHGDARPCVKEEADPEH